MLDEPARQHGEPVDQRLRLARPWVSTMPTTTSTPLQASARAHATASRRSCRRRGPRPGRPSADPQPWRLQLAEQGIGLRSAPMTNHSLDPDHSMKPQAPERRQRPPPARSKAWQPRNWRSSARFSSSTLTRGWPKHAELRCWLWRATRPAMTMPASTPRALRDARHLHARAGRAEVRIDTAAGLVISSPGTAPGRCPRARPRWRWLRRCAHAASGLLRAWLLPARGHRVVIGGRRPRLEVARIGEGLGDQHGADDLPSRSTRLPAAAGNSARPIPAPASE
jgi:hypothetical protein